MKKIQKSLFKSHPKDVRVHISFYGWQFSRNKKNGCPDPLFQYYGGNDAKLAHEMQKKEEENNKDKETKRRLHSKW